MIINVSQQTVSNYATVDINQDSNNSAKTNGNANVQERNTVNTGVSVEISEGAKNLSLQMKGYGADSPFKLDAEFFSKDAREQRRLESAKAMAESSNIDPFDNEFQILGVQYTFVSGSLGEFITNNLEGKARNASLVASELSMMIRGTISNPNATVEERAINRETAIKNAEYIAQNYFDDPDEAKAFLDGINRFAENDIWREKGYIVFDNSDMPPFKSYTMPNAPEGYINGNAYAKKLGVSNIMEIFQDPKKFETFISESSKLKAEVVASFNNNEKKVSDIISKVKELLNPTDVANSLQRLLKAF